LPRLGAQGDDSLDRVGRGQLREVDGTVAKARLAEDALQTIDEISLELDDGLGQPRVVRFDAEDFQPVRQAAERVGRSLRVGLRIGQIADEFVEHGERRGGIEVVVERGFHLRVDLRKAARPFLATCGQEPVGRLDSLEPRPAAAIESSVKFMTFR
jgi:hypothetical protein